MLTTESGCEQAGIAFSSKPREKDVELTSDRHQKAGKSYSYASKPHKRPRTVEKEPERLRYSWNKRVNQGQGNF